MSIRATGVIGPPRTAELFPAAWSQTIQVMAETTTKYGSLVSVRRGIDMFQAQPAPMTTNPSAQTRGLAFSSDGTYMAVGYLQSPYLRLFKRGGGAGEPYNTITNPASMPTTAVMCCAFSPDDVYLAVCLSGSPYFSLYKRTGDTFAKVTNPASMPTGAAHSCEFSRNGAFLLVSGLTPSMCCYKRNGDSFTQIGIPTPSYAVRTAKFSPDSNFVAAFADGSIAIYRYTGTQFVAMKTYTGTFGTPQGGGWTGDGKVIVTAISKAPFIYMLRRNTVGEFVAAEPIDPPTGPWTPTGCGVSPDGRYVIGCSATGQIYTYEYDGFENMFPSYLPIEGGGYFSCAFSWDGSVYGVSTSGSESLGVSVFNSTTYTAASWLDQNAIKHPFFLCVGMAEKAVNYRESVPVNVLSPMNRAWGFTV